MTSQSKAGFRFDNLTSLKPKKKEPHPNKLSNLNLSLTESILKFQAAIKAKYGLDATAVGDEGGFAPNFQNNKVHIFCLFFLFLRQQWYFVTKIVLTFCEKNCSSDCENLLTFGNFLRSLEQFTYSNSER